MYFGLEAHKKTISYCVKDPIGRIQPEGKVGSTGLLDEDAASTVDGGHGGDDLRRLDL